MKALVNIEFVQGCKNNCIACTNIKKTPLRFMDMNTLSRIVYNINSVLEDELFIKVFGIGNSLLHPYFTAYCRYLYEHFPKSLLILSSNYRDIIRYKEVDLSLLNRVLLTIQPYDVDLEVLSKCVAHLKSIGIKQFRIIYLTPAFVDHDQNIKNLVEFCNENTEDGYLIVGRFLRHRFGYNDKCEYSDIPFFYEEGIQNDSVEKLRNLIGEEYFFKQVKGFVNEINICPISKKSPPSLVFDYMGNIHTCISRNSPTSDLKEYTDNYLKVVKECCNDCPVMLEDFVVQISARKDFEPVIATCSCHCFEDDYIRCP